MDKAIETLDLTKIRKVLQIEDEDLLNKYLKEIWSDLSKRSIEETAKGINKITFNKYYDMPGIISERLFTVFDKDKDGVLNLQEFVTGMKMLFSQAETFDSLAKFIFNFYDFRNCGKIKKEDVRVVLSYVPLQKTDLNSIKEGNIEIVEENFQDRVESQEQLFNILNIAFKNKEEMNFEEYTNVVKNVNSDIFILILMFLLEKKPFTSATLKIYGSKSDSKVEDVSKTPKIAQQVIASPSLNSRFLSPKLKKKSLMQKGKKANLGAAQNILQLYSGVENKPAEKDDKKEKAKDNKDSKRPQRRARIKLDNLMDKTPEMSKSTFTFGKNKGQESLPDDDDDDFKIEEEECVQYEGYVYKYSQTQKKMKKTYFKLVGKDLYYYKKKEEEKHRGMHNLSGVFIKRGEDLELDGK